MCIYVDFNVCVHDVVPLPANPGCSVYSSRGGNQELETEYLEKNDYEAKICMSSTYCVGVWKVYMYVVYI